jgi:hypothetical protein
MKIWVYMIFLVSIVNSIKQWSTFLNWDNIISTNDCETDNCFGEEDSRSRGRENTRRDETISTRRPTHARPEEKIVCKKYLSLCYNPNTSVDLTCTYTTESLVCYDKAECKVQNNGQCGFTITQDFITCLKNSGIPSSDIPSASTNNTFTSSINSTILINPGDTSMFNSTNTRDQLSPSIIQPSTLNGPCKPTGCYNTVCSDKIEPTNQCKFKPEYDCYKTSKCLTTNGICGWTHDDNFFNCFMNSQ